MLKCRIDAELLKDLGLSADELLSQTELVKNVLLFHVLVSNAIIVTRPVILNIISVLYFWHQIRKASSNTISLFWP